MWLIVQNKGACECSWYTKDCNDNNMNFGVIISSQEEIKNEMIIINKYKTNVITGYDIATAQSLITIQTECLLLMNR